MNALRRFAVAAMVLGSGCADELMEASGGFSTLPNGGSDPSETFTPMTDGSSGTGVPTTSATGGSLSGGDEDSTSEAGSSGGTGTSTSGGGTTGTTTFGSSTSGPDDTSTGPVIGGCGNGTIDPNEQCDGQNLNGFTCESLGNSGGTLLCDPVMCTFDTSMCTNDMSGGTSG